MIELLSYQYEFVMDTSTRFIGLIGGYGSGKTVSAVWKAIDLASRNVGYRGALLEPTNVMVRDVLIPQMDLALEEAGIPHEFRASPYPEYKLYFEDGCSTILLRSAENYKRLVGLNLAWFGVDEADTIERRLAWQMWTVLISRLRTGDVNQGFTTSTPEGFGFLYELFVKKDGDDRRFVQARSSDNPHLPQEFLESLAVNYDPQQIKAYMNGEFVNLNSETIYYSFDRNLNHSDISLSDDKYSKHILHIGQDFNIGKCASVVHIVVDGKPIAVDEIIGAKNTEQVIEIVKSRYPGRAIRFYPDSSGKNNKTNATVTDIILLQQAFGRTNVIFSTKNPRVSSRIGSMNAMFCNSKNERRYLVNTTMCPRYTETLEQQSYNKFGEPDKSHDLDHPNDAAGYFIHMMYPLASRSSLQSY